MDNPRNKIIAGTTITVEEDDSYCRIITTGWSIEDAITIKPKVENNQQLRK